MEDMEIDLEKYKEEHKKLKKEIAKAMGSKASKEELNILREKLFNTLFKIEVLESEIEKGGKTK